MMPAIPSSLQLLLFPKSWSTASSEVTVSPHCQHRSRAFLQSSVGGVHVSMGAVVLAALLVFWLPHSQPR